MLSIDTNILFHGFNEDSPRHASAHAWLVSIAGEEKWRQDYKHTCL